MNLIEFQLKFKDEQVCIDWLIEKRWGLKEKAVCPNCGHKECYTHKNHSLFTCKSCLRQFTIRIGTIFEDSRLPLYKWFLAIYLFSSLKKGLSSIQLAKYISVTQKTAWFMLQRIREVMKDGNGGGGLMNGVVEIDEAYLGGSETNKHATNKGKTEKKVVIGIVNRQTGEVIAKNVESNKTEDLQPVIYKNVKDNATIITDSYFGYNNLKQNYKHKIIKHSAGEYVRVEAEIAFKVHANTIEGFWSWLKRGIEGIYHWVSKKHINKYLNEFSFRYNKRKLNDFDIFTNWFSGFEGKRLEYKVLVG